ncbi:ABC transporter ATP-binding protein [Celeribacter indicus]|uniref:Oligopeptide/dipeptide ABC transporter ATPase n=1 Tax=Celeribacter indicus TaxID=1208324 RepID=A0A0B5DWM6_9RHOB|nr:ABC transporter ATP-binding protein [Celeribacter indicus]AJE47823.1 oligopeptide/dipeptide ABC transporter ATPase [Celeribacter indicus]SDW24044.1 peptide/nickel transport system ATP-binding protein [Celeribacter indicus]
MTTPILTISGLKTHFALRAGTVKAVDGVNLEVPRGKTLCIVGESGSGKSITARSVLQIVAEPGRVVGGEILFRPKGAPPVDLATLDPRGRQIRAIRGRDIAMIFQEPMNSLSPVHTVGAQIVEKIRLHEKVSVRTAKKMTIEALDRVGIPDAARNFNSYPIEMSGGMRQRAMIGMALACRPELLIADEPTTALDVSTQANILDLIRGLQDETQMSVIFITHDLGVVAEIADEVAVMYLGRIVERGDVDAIFYDPQHPYTQALLNSIPRLGARRAAGKRLFAIPGMVPHPLARPSGCPFRTRCPEARAGLCDVLEPPQVTFGDGHVAYCHLRTPAAVKEKEEALTK